MKRQRKERESASKALEDISKVWTTVDDMPKKVPRAFLPRSEFGATAREIVRPGRMVREVVPQSPTSPTHVPGSALAYLEELEDDDVELLHGLDKAASPSGESLGREKSSRTDMGSVFDEARRSETVVWTIEPQSGLAFALRPEQRELLADVRSKLEKRKVTLDDSTKGFKWTDTLNRGILDETRLKGLRLRTWNPADKRAGKPLNQRYGRWYIEPERWKLEEKKGVQRKGQLAASAPPPEDPHMARVEKMKEKAKRRLYDTISTMDGPFIYRSYLRQYDPLGETSDDRHKPSRLPNFISRLPSTKQRRKPPHVRRKK